MTAHTDECEDNMTTSERQSMLPGNYVMNTISNSRPVPIDASFGILANSFGAPAPSLISAEDDLMNRTIVLSRCGRVPARVHAAEVEASLNAQHSTSSSARRSTDQQGATPLTEYLTRSRKACSPVPTITNDRIADPSILLRDPHTAVLQPQFYHRPTDIGLEMRDAFRKCERSTPKRYDSVFAA